MSEKPNKIILHIEDDSNIRMSTRYALEDEGYTVYQASNGEEAFEFLLGTHPKIDFILLDTMMPVMDGYAFHVERMKHKTLSQIPSIIYSADYSNRTKAEGLGLTFMQKPFDLANLFKKIEEKISASTST
jgi:DNA-binding response OmpR family regulator